jgi:hypothetical protein
MYIGKPMEFVLTISNDDSEWDTLVAASPQGSVFSGSHYLRALGSPSTRYVIRTPHGEALAGVAVMENVDAPGMHSAPFPFTPYQGILFGQTVAVQPRHKRVTTEFRLTDFIIQRLIERYSDFSMALSPALDDIRPFLWHNYHLPDAPHFTIRNRYTAVLDLSCFQLESYLKSIRAVRRQEFNKSTAEIATTTNVALFLSLYLKTFERQSIAVSKQHQALVRDICTSALTHGYGRLSIADTASGVASMSLFIHDEHCAYYLFGANDPELRNSGASTALMVDNIRSMSERGIAKLDFVGVNSPNRGDFKLSFNPELMPYHEVQLVAPPARPGHAA